VEVTILLSRVLKYVDSREQTLAQISVTDVADEVLKTSFTPADTEIPNSTDVDTQALVQQTQDTCTELLEDARQQRQAILANAEADAEEMRKLASQEGYEAGFAAGEEAAKQDAQVLMSEQMALAEKIVRQAQVRYETALHSLHTVVAGIVADALQTLLQRELMLAPAAIETMVRTMLESVEHASRVEVRVNPAEFEEAVAKNGHWLTEGLGDWHITVIPDTEIHAGGCMIQAPHGRVDGRLETRLELVQTMLNQLLERGALDELESEGTA
jgi:flagellar assembly protein FliH